MVDLGRTDDLTDDDLVRLFRNGDAEAFDLLFDRYHRRAYGFARFLLDDETAAEEVMQETFLAVARSARTYEPRGSFRAWVMSIVRNRCLNRLESARVRRSVEAETGPETAEAPARGPTPAARAEENERIALVRRGLDRLPPRQREALVLHAIEDMEYREIADVLRMPMGTVKTLIHRARASLARALEGAGEAKGTDRDGS